MSDDKKHTPGPWEEEYGDSEAIYISKEFGEGPQVKIVAKVYRAECTLEEVLANVNLITAAPSLLAALEGLAAEMCELCDKHIDCATGHNDPCGNIVQAKAALKLARGEG